MPRLQAGIQREVEAREDELAQFIEAREQVEKLGVLATVLHHRNAYGASYYQDICKALRYVDSALQIGKHNTAQLRERVRERR